MTRTLSTSFRQATEALFSNVAQIVFLTITHDDLVDPIYVVNNTQDMIRNDTGQVFIGFPFDIQILSDDEQSPQAQLAIQNVDSGIGAAIRDLVTPPRLKIEIVQSSDYYPYPFTAFYIFPTTLVGSASFNVAASLAEITGSSSGSFSQDSSFFYRGNGSLKFPAQGSSPQATFLGSATTIPWFRFAAYFPALPTGNCYIGGIKRATDVQIASVYITNTGQVFVHNNVSGLNYFTGVFVTAGQWHVFELFDIVDATTGVLALIVDKAFVFFQDTLNTGTAAGDRAFVGMVQITGTFPQGIWFDELSLWNFISLESVIYVADKLFLTNVSVDAMTISGKIEGWNYTQRVWPQPRARQDIFPGLFK